MSAKKRELRRDYRRVLENLDPRWVSAASIALCKELEDLLENKIDRTIEHVLCFVPVFPGEVDLSSFIQSQLEKRSVYLPSVREDRTMTFLSVAENWRDFLVPGDVSMTLSQSTKGTAFSPKNALHAAVIVPGLTFDLEGNRLGRGKGYYDRFLGSLSMKGALHIGVCWKLQIADQVPTESHDILMDWICHEREGVFTGVKWEE